MTLKVLHRGIITDSYLSQVEEEAGVLSGLWEVRQEHCDTDEQNGGILTHLPQRLKKRQTEKRHAAVRPSVSLQMSLWDSNVPAWEFIDLQMYSSINGPD